MHERPNAEQQIRLKRFIYPASYTDVTVMRAPAIDDIAIAELAEPVKFTNRVNPVCLPYKTMKRFTNLMITGWGLTSPFSTARALQELDEKEINLPSCRNQIGDFLREQFGPFGIFRDFEKVHDGDYSTLATADHLCVEGKKDSACPGDSGSPLVTFRNGRFFQAGVYSWGWPCSVSTRRLFYPGIYTRVTSYLNWIRDNTKGANWCA